MLEKIKIVLAAVAICFAGQGYAQDQNVSNQYILQSGDRIFIQVFDEPDLTMETTVGQSGSINYSYLGTVEVAGQSAQQLTDVITAKLRDGYLHNPSVNVTVQQYRSFFVNGEVRRPGSYAGGMTDRASRRKITLTREVDGDRKDYQVEMTQSIEPGDIITIKEGFF